MNPLEGLLKVCDQISNLQVSAIDGKLNPSNLAEARLKVSNLRESVYSQLPTMKEQLAVVDLSDHEIFLLAMLFRKRLSGDDRMLDGGSIVGLLATAGFERTISLGILGAEGRLRTSGWLLSQNQTRAADPIDTWFGPSSAALELFWQQSPRQDVAEATTVIRNTPYRDEEEYLWQLYEWRNLCLSRAETLFPADLPGSSPSPQFSNYRERSRSSMTAIRSRLAITPGSDNFQIEQFRKQHKLGMDQLLVVVHLLFSELVEGEPFISAIECLRVISETRRDLFSKRKLLGPRGLLRRTGIVLDSSSNELDKALATDLTLADWASEGLVSGMNTPLRFDGQELDDFLKGDDN